jgi:hypothetical protein
VIKSLLYALKNTPMSSSQSQADATPYVSQQDVDAYRQRANQLEQQLQSAVNSGDSASASRIAGQAAEARAELRNIETQFESQRAMHEQENAWIKQQTNKVYDIQRSIAEQRALIDDTQIMLQKFFDEPQRQTPSSAPNNHHQRQQRTKEPGLIDSVLSAFNPSPPPANNLMQQRAAAQAANQQKSSPPEPPYIALLAKARHNIRLCQVNLEQQNLKVDSIDMSSHPSASNEAHAAAIAANPSSSLLSIKAVRKDTVDRIQKELAYADTFAHHLDEFEKFIAFIHQPVQQQPHQSQSNTQARNSPQRPHHR